MKAMILAAGRGERMRPLSDSIPKPLLPLHGEMLIEKHLRRLAAINVRDIVINISYLADQIRSALGDGSQYGVTITYSYEPEPLEAAGGIIQALPLLGQDPFIMVSADIVVDYPFEKLYLRELNHLGHLVCVENPIWHTAGDFGIAQQFIISKAEAEKTYTYANVGIISPQLVAGYEPGKRKIGAIFEQAAQKKLLSGEIYSGVWHNIGTIALYEEAKQMICSQKGCTA
jgi:MurNAc alpha-1-phosphate uridylyltransferase